MIGGIDGPKIDIENITEEEIRGEVRRAIDTYCPAGRFIRAFPTESASGNGIMRSLWMS